jgi:S-adenosylhomocysteine hydrolase
MMTKQQLHKFIKDTKGLVRGASPEKKVKLLKLIKEAKRQCEEQELKEMDLDHDKIGDTLDSKYATAALVGALKAAGAEATEIEPQSPETDSSETIDYLEEK